MRIIVTGYHPADPADIVGGVEAITLRLVEGLAQIGGHEIHAVTTRRDLARYETRSLAGRTVHLLPADRRMGNFSLMRRDRSRLLSLFGTLRPDVIHAHGTTEYALAALESGFPTVVSIHGILRAEARLAAGPFDRLRWRFRVALENRVLARARHLILVSPYVSEVFGTLFAAACTHLIETSVSDLFFARPPEPVAEAPRVVYSGLIIPRKGILELVDAARRVAGRYPHAEFRLAGRATDPAYERRVRDAIGAAGLDGRVHLLGGLAPEALALELSRASLLVLPSFQETAPVAIQEAMAAGVPVVATDVGGNRHLVQEGATGRIVPAGDIDALSGAIASLLASPERAGAMGARGREEARRRFASGPVAARTVEVYREVIADAAARS